MEKIKNIIIGIVCGLFVYSNNKIYAIERIYKSDQFTAVYELTEGHLTGKYTSYFKNGNKKAEGFLQNGLRTGNWKLWDSIGNLSIEFVYFSPFNRKKVFPPLPQDPTIQLFQSDSFDFNPKNQWFNPFIDHLTLNTTECKANIELDSNYNEVILKSNFIKSIVQMINTGELEAFDCTQNANWPEKWNHKTQFTQKDIKKIIIQESFLFDFHHMLSSWYFIGLEFYFQSKKPNEEFRLLIYHSSIKEIVTQLNIDKKLFPKSINSINDWILYRYYIGKNTSIECYNASAFQFNDWSIEMLEKEHDFWYKYY